LRTVNLVVEVFIDIAEDGTAYAEALMLRSADMYFMGQGFARLEPDDPDVEPVDDGQLAARALVDLAETLIYDTDGDGDDIEKRAPPLADWVGGRQPPCPASRDVGWRGGALPSR